MELGLKRCFSLLFVGLCGLVLSSCASSPPVMPCDSAIRERPPLTLECREQYDSQRYIAKLGSELGDRLIGHRAYLGELDLSVGFGDHGEVESVCRRRFTGAKVGERSRAAVADLHQQPAAPFCFAGHRIELAWESPVVTEAEIRAVMTTCHGAARAPTRGLALCFSVQYCGDADYEQLFDEFNGLFGGCVLNKLPLTFLVESSGEILNFLPQPNSSPTGPLALEALQACPTPGASREALIACMAERGWEPGDWERPPTRNVGVGKWLRDD